MSVGITEGVTDGLGVGAVDGPTVDGAADGTRLGFVDGTADGAYVVRAKATTVAVLVTTASLYENNAPVVQPTSTDSAPPAINVPAILELLAIVAVVPTFHQTLTADVGELITRIVTPTPTERDVSVLNIHAESAVFAASRVIVTPAAMLRELVAVYVPGCRVTEDDQEDTSTPGP
jgi:hypothetical protein